MYQNTISIKKFTKNKEQELIIERFNELFLYTMKVMLVKN